MEFPSYNIQALFTKDVSCLTSSIVSRLSHDKASHVAHVIDAMGAASAKAQGLPQVITNASKLSSSDHRLYVAVLPPKAVSGILKVGRKKLFIRTESGEIREIEPLCVLDFYVHESLQRQGVGLLLFRRMLMSEGVTPQRLAYDRPSPKLLAFLNKHYKLSRYVPQPNNFVVFKDYFESDKKASRESFDSTNRPTSAKKSSLRSTSAPTLRDSRDPAKAFDGPLPSDYEPRVHEPFSRQQRSHRESADANGAPSHYPLAGRRRGPSSMDELPSMPRISTNKSDLQHPTESMSTVASEISPTSGTQQYASGRRAISNTTQGTNSTPYTASVSASVSRGLVGPTASAIRPQYVPSHQQLQQQQQHQQQQQQRWKSGLDAPFATASFQGDLPFSSSSAAGVDVTSISQSSRSIDNRPSAYIQSPRERIRDVQDQRPRADVRQSR
eukprot:TRINITY_DN9862_c2_g1_i3.p1 TRINITY_DN9862_c2_g1~~TRINITY_DN9862_c2_g1_i3.p1  ORF type:complete len:441 (-),score=96.32 TRINITY_DN9862_c2_g1_i3:250-1572(-)